MRKVYTHVKLPSIIPTVNLWTQNEIESCQLVINWYLLSNKILTAYKWSSDKEQTTQPKMGWYLAFFAFWSCFWSTTRRGRRNIFAFVFHTTTDTLSYHSIALWWACCNVFVRWLVTRASRAFPLWTSTIIFLKYKGKLNCFELLLKIS